MIHRSSSAQEMDCYCCWRVGYVTFLQLDARLMVHHEMFVEELKARVLRFSNKGMAQWFCVTSGGVLTPAEKAKM